MDGIKTADLIGACLLCGIVVWFAGATMGQAPRENAAYERGKNDQYVRQLEFEKSYQQGKIDGLQYGR